MIPREGGLLEGVLDGAPRPSNLGDESNGFPIRFRFPAVGFLGLILIITGSCARQTFEDLQSPQTALSLVKTLIPDRNATDVRLDIPVQVVFAKGMDPVTVNNATFYVQDAAGDTVPGTATYLNGARTAQFTAADGFDFLSTYTVTLTTGVSDPQGNALTDPVVWSFTTEKLPLTIGANVRVTDYAPAGYPAGAFSSGECGLAESGGEIYAVWYDNRTGAGHIYFAKSSDGGATFGPNVKVDDDTTPTNHEYPCLAVDAQGNVDVVWDDQRDIQTEYDVYFARSTDGGATFGPNVKINHDGTPYDQTTASLVVGPDGTIYVAWRDFRNQILDVHSHPTNADIFVSTSTDGGQTFAPEVRVNDDAGTADQNHPSIGVDDSGRVYVAWTDQRNLDVNGSNGDIYFSVGTLSGSVLAFGPNILINDDTVYANQHDPSLRIGPGGEVLIAWADHRNGGNSNIYFSKSVDGGVTFSPNLAVSPVFKGGQDVPSLAVNASGLIVVTWQNSVPQQGGPALIDILAGTSTDDGASFHTALTVNDDTNLAGQRQSNAAIDDSGQVYVIWADERNGDGSGANFDIYFAKGH